MDPREEYIVITAYVHSKSIDCQKDYAAEDKIEQALVS